MHALIIYCHPEPKSFNGALKDVAVDTLQQAGHTVEVADLYGENFDPLEKADHYTQRAEPDWFSGMNEQRHASETNSLPTDISRYIEQLVRADLVIFQFPLWWHAQPAILKGYFDRVFVAGKLYTSRMRYDQGFFKGKRAICSVTTGASAATFNENGRGGDMDVMLWPIQYSIYYMGFTVLSPFISYGVQNHASHFDRLEGHYLDNHLMQLKNAWAAQLQAIDLAVPVTFPGWDDWDETGRPQIIGK